MRLLRERVVDRTPSPVLEKLLVGSRSSVYDFCVDYKDISERIVLLTQEIHDLQEMNARYWKQSEYTRRISRAAHESREIRLRQIREELSRMMLKLTA